MSLVHTEKCRRLFRNRYGQFLLRVISKIRLLKIVPLMLFFFWEVPKVSRPLGMAHLIFMFLHTPLERSPLPTFTFLNFIQSSRILTNLIFFPWNFLTCPGNDDFNVIPENLVYIYCPQLVWILLHYHTWLTKKHLSNEFIPNLKLDDVRFH